MSKFPYKALNNFVIRTPSKSLSSLKKILEEEKINKNDLKKIYSDYFFQEAIYLASPSLFDILQKWLKNESLSKEKEEKLNISLLKYRSRMSTRCTPFGLFSGYAIGKLDNKTEIELKHEEEFKRYTRLDMHYLVNLVQNIIKKNPRIQKTLNFSPNTSLYSIGNEYRYVEYLYSKGLNRTYYLQAIEKNIYLNFIITLCSKKNLNIDQIAEEVIKFDSEIKKTEAIKYIKTLIDNQIIVSNSDPVIIGKDYFSAIREIFNFSKKYTKIFNKISNQLKLIDKKIPNQNKSYSELNLIADELNLDINRKYFLQTDLNITLNKNTLEKKHIKDIKEGLIFLNKLSIISKNKQSTNLDNFIKSFQKRYEDKEVPLCIALDTESGIDYKNYRNKEIIADNTFIDNIIIPPMNSSKDEIRWSNTNSILHYKFSEAYKNNDYVIKFEQSDLPNWIEEKWDDLPDTMSFMIELVNIDNKTKIKIDGSGGASGANIFGRFCLNDIDLYHHTKEIIEIEQKINHDYIFADISHLPESRIGNVINRNSFNNYEIPYLSKSLKDKEFQIPIDDLLISVKSNQIVLRSKKLNKKIMPRLINAHNYELNSLPIYHFLCDIQNQGKRNGLYLDIGPMEKKYKFIPRIELGNLILKPATWNLRKKDMIIFTEKIQAEEQLLDLSNSTRIKWKMPQYILYCENDNELLINLKNIDSIKMMIDAIGEKQNFTFKEFLFVDKEQIVSSNNDFYTNQIAITFYNQQKYQNAVS